MPNLQFANTEPNEIQFDHSVNVNPFTGSANVSIPLQFTPGRGEFGPVCSLEYDSLGVNSPFGVGWSLSGLLSISVNTRKHLPRYDGTDEFVFNAVGELVPALDGANQWQPLVIDAGDYWVRLHRPRVERGFLRIEQWLEKSTSRVHWRTRDARNVLTIFGLRDDGLSRIADPRDPLRTFVWLPDATYDPKGNAIAFEYLAENLDQVDRSQSFETSRVNPTAQRYLKRILYGNSVPVEADTAVPAANRWAYEVVVDYGDHSSASVAAAVPDQAWSVRPDPFSTFRAGFEVRTYRLCRRILQFHNFPAFTSTPGPFLTGSYNLNHDLNPAGTTLGTVGYTGYRVEMSTANISQRSLPPLVMTYTQPSVGVSFSPAPAEALQNVPYALAEPRFRWVDLFGEGLPGLLTESAGGWFYNSNEGAGNFAPQQSISRQPACDLADFVLNDFDADGNTDVAVMHGRAAGFYEFNRDSGEWRNFRLIPEMPHLEGAPSAQWLDLNGDGRQDLVLTSPSQVLWFPSQGRDGFGDPVEVPRPQTEGDLAPLNQDLRLDYFFADMSGGGLLDQVRVQNGRVEYWPQLGNGQFGDSILIEDSPIFAPTGQFDPSRVLLVDLDGSGGADIVYLGDGEVRYWINASGNRLLEGCVVPNLPYIDNASSARVLDLFGDGTPCLVWCSPSANGDSAIQYLPLTDGVKPRLLLSVNNSMGMEIDLSYSTSATHYLCDKRRGRPWRTRIPSHPIVVDRREVIDAIGGNRTATRYEYHDGYYDGTERSFAGFGAVDQFDADAGDPSATDPEITLTAPACLRTWFHQGYPWQGIPQCAYQGDAKQAVLASMVFDHPDELESRDYCEGWRALVGMVIRQELFALTAAGKLANDSFKVTETSYRVRMQQPAQGEHEGSFLAFVSETLNYTYEQTSSDPRVKHDFTLEIDSFGNPTLECSVAYPRRSAVAVVDSAQRRTLISATRQAFLNIDNRARHELAIPFETQEFELAGINPPRDGVLDWTTLRQVLDTALDNPLAFDQDFTSGLQARLIRWNRTYYWRDSADISLPLGQVGEPVLLHHVDNACFTMAWVTSALGARVDRNLLQNDAGCVLKEGYWWQSGETWVWNAASGFFQLASLQRAEGVATTFNYDADFMQITQIQDALGNITRSEVDYNLPAPFRIVDENNNVSETLYDPLGIAVVSTSYGQLLDAKGTPQSYGNDALTSYAMQPNPSFDAVLADPASFLQTQSQFTFYELDSWTAKAIPPRSVKLVRELFTHDATGGAAVTASRIQIAVVHSDGFRNVLQTKLLAEPGPALQRDSSGHLVLDANGIPVEGPPGERWLANGHTLYNRKQLPVRQYEPFYSVTPQYEPEDTLAHYGVYHEFHYDATGRQVREDFPNGTFSRNQYSSWETLAYDPNDTVLDSTYKALRDGLPSTDPEKMALIKTEAHANTPVHVQLNPQGLEIRRVNSAAPGDDRITSATLDINGRTTSLTDARGLTAFTYGLDMNGRPLFIHSIDAGDRAVVLDAYDRAVHQWDAIGLHEFRRFDALDRPLSLSVDGALGLNQMVQQYIYGEDASIPQAQFKNLRGRLALLRDEAGTVSFDLCDPEGRVLRSTRQLRADYKSEPDWTNPSAIVLAPDSYLSAITVDALGRIVIDSPPDGTTRQLQYLQGGGLEQVTISSSDGKLANSVVLSGAEYNARGERTKVLLGNGVEMDRTFDSETFLVTRIAATRNGGGDPKVLQDLRYTYDPVANIVHSVDQAQMPAAAGPFLQGLNVSPDSDFTYDALYQLTMATGRVHQALLENDYVPGAPGTTKGTRHLNFNNGAAIERYQRSYCYDLAGNLKSGSHQGVTQNWKSKFWVSASCNRSLPALDTAGNPITNPESRFDGNGNCVYFPYLRSIAWNYHRSVARAVVIDRTGTGNPDDAEYYVYDSGGTRIRKVTETLVAGQLQVTDVIYFEGCEIKRMSLGARPTLARATSHIADDTGRIALIYRWSMDASGLKTADISSARTRYQLTNHLGSSMLELDEQGAVITYEEYFPFGGTAFIAGDNDKEISIRVYRFCGKERDDTTGLYYFGYRYYACWMGRWISPDPIGPEDDINLYRYVQNNPVCLYDPDGLQAHPAGFQQFIPFEDLPPVMQTSEVKQYGGSVAYTAEKNPQFRMAKDAADFMQIVKEHHGWFNVYSPLLQSFYESLREKGESKARAMKGAQQLLELMNAVHEIGEEAKSGMKDGEETGDGERKGDGEGKGEAGDKKADAGGDGAGSAAADGNGDGGAKGPSGNPADSKDTSSSSGTGNSQTNNASGASTEKTPPSTPDQSNKDTGDRGGKGGGADGGTGEPKGGKKGTGPGAKRKNGAGDALSELYSMIDGKPGGVKQGLPGGEVGGTGTTPGGSINGDPRGTATSANRVKPPNGLVHPTPGQGRGTGSKDAGGAGAGGTGSKQNAGARGSGNDPNTNGQGKGGQGGKNEKKADPGWWQDVLKVAGVTNLSFGDDPGGAPSGGIPGGEGTHRSFLGQIAYVALSIVNLITMIKSVVQSVAKGALTRLYRVLTSPRAWITAIEEFRGELAGAWSKFWKSAGGWSPKRRMMQILKAVFWDKRTYEAIRDWRNSASFLFKPRLFGTLEKVGTESLYTWEHIIPQSWGRKFTRLNPFINSYLNSFLRIPKTLNSSIGDFTVRKVVFYYGAARALITSWGAGQWLGHKIVDQQAPQNPSQ